MKNKLQLSIITLLLFVSQLLNASTPTIISLQRKIRPTTIENTRPSKSPSLSMISLEMTFDAENSSILCEDLESNTYSYIIYDSLEVPLIQGTLDFTHDETICISCFALQQGIYTIEVVHNNVTYIGTFNIE